MKIKPQILIPKHTHTTGITDESTKEINKSETKLKIIIMIENRKIVGQSLLLDLTQNPFAIQHSPNLAWS